LRLRIDLHLHTVHSSDSCISVDEAIRRCRAARLDGFAVTDHDTLSGIPEAVERRGDLVVVPGVEVSAHGAHILALGVSKPVPPGLPIAETVERIREQGALAIIAHPYSTFKTWVNRRELEGAGLDAVEVANSAQFPYGWMLKRNVALAERLGLPQTGGSDAHIPEAVGRAYTVIEADSRDAKGVLHAIRGGHTEARGSGITLYERIKKLIKA